VRRWTLLVAGAALWLFLAAVPALADGGPHVAANNSGQSTLTADSCAGCHRAHTAQGPMITTELDPNDLCISCHGTNGTGATANVEDGVQYAVANDGSGTGTVAGALRAGGFVNARISASGNLLVDGSPVISRKSYPRWDSNSVPNVMVTSYSAQVPALTTGKAVTSAHMHVGSSGITAKNVAWGYGALGTANAGAAVTLECVSCHNPHGNSQYRILKKFTADQDAPPTGIDASTGTGRLLADVRTNPAGSGAAGTRNYTVKWGATLADVVNGTYTNPDSAMGDYWRRLQPYSTTPTANTPPTGTTNPTGYYRGDMPEFTGAPNTGGPSSSTTWRNGISSWCSQCHTRYHTLGSVANTTGLIQSTDSGDSIFKYRHGTTSSECTQCHVSHGSNAVMDSDTGTAGLQGFAANFPYPDSSLSASSRLLKVGNRGTCQMCHDPTGTITVGTLLPGGSPIVLP